jgi:hypothetical protein
MGKVHGPSALLAIKEREKFELTNSVTLQTS